MSAHNVPKAGQDQASYPATIKLTEYLLFRGPMSGVGPEAMGTAAKVWHRCRCAKPMEVPP